MASVVEIWNLALASFGESRTVHLETENSEHARQCKLHYDHSRRALLKGAYSWGFSRKPVTLAENVANDLADTWAYSYVLPATMLKFLGFDGYASDAQPDYLIANGNIYCHVPLAKAWIVEDVTDTEAFPQGFVDALSAGLAARVVFPLTRDAAMRRDAMTIAAQTRAQAEADDANNYVNTVSQVSAFNEARA